MDTKTPIKGKQRVLIQPSIYQLIMDKVPEHKRHQPLSPIVNDLLYEHLNPCVTLNKPRTEGSEGAKVYSNNNKDNEYSDTEKALAKSSAATKGFKDLTLKYDFDEFWKIYRSSPKGVNSPKKHRALEEFCLLAKRGIKSELLIKAAQIAVRDQKLKIETEGDCLCLPDAFRWLRDGVYESLLDEAATAPQQYNSNTPTIL